jgi:hypothetical protein
MLNISNSLKITCPELAETRFKLLELQNGGAVRAIAQGFRSWGEQVRTVALTRTPVDTGALRSTVGTKVEISGDKVTVSLHAGGPAGSSGAPPSPGRSARTGKAAPESVGYAVHVHENVGSGVKWNARGTGAKYIENPINENIDKLDKEVVYYIEKAIERMSK